jgi:transcriptional regulator GlxA family with amidase domain
MELTRNVIIAVFPECEPMDVAATMRTFREANACGARYAVTVASTRPTVARGDVVIVPGFSTRETRPPDELVDWLRDSVATGAQTCAINSGAFALGEAGLLEQRNCTTHWKLLAELQTRFPTAHVLRDRLLVADGAVTTSAGVASGIDVALWFVEQHFGPRLAACVAREMVVPLRRDGSESAEGVALDYRMHGHSGVHRVQDYLIANVDRKTRIPELAAIARMGTRTLTRAFRMSTGLSIAEYRSKIRLEAARALLKDPNVTVSHVAETVGFHDARQLRRVWKSAFGVTPSHSRACS